MNRFFVLSVFIYILCLNAGGKALFDQSVFKKITDLETSSQTLHAETQKKSWTVMIYASLDIEEMLESALLKEFTDMVEAANPKEKLHVTAQIDLRKSEGKQTKRYYVKSGRLHIRSKSPNLNAGAPENLSEFLKWSMKYPSDHKALLIMGHGTGALSLTGPGTGKNGKSFLYDMGNNDCMTLNEASSVFSGILSSGQKMDVLCFRSCLMGQIEVAESFSKYFDYMVASSTVQVGVSGLFNDYNGVPISFECDIFNQLNRKPDSSGEETAKAFYESILKTNAKYTGVTGSRFEISCLKLNDIPAVVTLFKDVCENLKQSFDIDNAAPGVNVTTRKLMSKCRSESVKYGGAFKGVYVNQPEDYEFVDFGQLLSALSRYSSGKLKESAEKCIDALEKSCLIRRNDKEIKGSLICGVTMVPESGTLNEMYRELFENTYQQLGFCELTGWDQVLHAYYGF